MSKVPVRRQHETTRIPELRGARCTAFLAVRDNQSGFVGPLYIELDGAWHRLFLDAGLLFWQEGLEPEPDDDLLGGEDYADYASELGVRGQTLEEVTMEDCQVSLRFQNGGHLVLRQRVQDDGTEVVEFAVGRQGAPEFIPEKPVPR